MSKEYEKQDLAPIKSLHLLNNYKFTKDKYLVNNKGIVYYKTGNGTYKELRPFIQRDGYVEYVLSDSNSVKKHIQAHLLVGHLYMNKPKGINLVINHKDGNKENNHISNLEWITISDNNKHKYRVLGHKPWNKKS